ncbi:MAG TPA: hypothetical protein VG276_28995 [Actinomycetes bacterium]|jgi:hypothetical protein|nr:hypothetical protein [Actinomycetes bacterium]
MNAQPQALFPFLAPGDRCTLVLVNGRVCPGTVIDLDARDGELRWVRVQSDAQGEGAVTVQGRAIAVWRRGEPIQAKPQIVETQVAPADLARLIGNGRPGR